MRINMPSIIWLQNAINAIANKETDKMVKDNVTVYGVKDVVRIDIKKEG